MGNIVCPAATARVSSIAEEKISGEDLSVVEYVTPVNSTSERNNGSGFDCLSFVPKSFIEKAITSGIVPKPFSPYYIATLYFLKSPVSLYYLRTIAQRRGVEMLLKCWKDLMSVKESTESEDVKTSLLVQLYVKYTTDNHIKFTIGRSSLFAPTVDKSSSTTVKVNDESTGMDSSLAVARGANIVESAYLMHDTNPDSVGAQNSSHESNSKVSSALNMLLHDVILQIYLDVLTPDVGATTLEDIMKKLFKALSVKKQMKVSDSDFLFEKVLGEGSFGMVVLCKKTSTGKKYAMKLQEKDEMLVTQEEDPDTDLCGECQVLAKCISPFITKLYYAFQTGKLAIMVMDYAELGDMNNFMKTRALKALPLNVAQFYIAELVCAVSYLHQKGFMHRDIKPGNLLVNRAGHLLLTDFGSVLESQKMVKEQPNTESSKFLKNLRKKKHTAGAKLVLSMFASASSSADAGDSDKEAGHMWQASGIAGTDSYMSPEIRYLMSLGRHEKQNVASYYFYTEAVDWWSVGVTAYKLMVGHHGISKHDITRIVAEYEFIGGAGDYLEAMKAYGGPASAITEELKLQMVPQLAPLSGGALPSDDAQNFVSSLLDVNFVTRLGSGVHGDDKLKGHAFFHPICWEDLEELKLKPPLSMGDDANSAVDNGDGFEGISKWRGKLRKLISTESVKERFSMNFEKILTGVGRSNWLPEQVAKFASISMGKSYYSVSEQSKMFKSWDFVSHDAIFDEAGLSID